MSDNKYMIFNQRAYLRTLSCVEEKGNSKVLEFNTEPEAQKYIIEKLQDKYGSKNFEVLNINEWHEKIEKTKEIEYNNDKFAEILSEISKEAEFIYDCCDNNINGFILPISVKDNNEYVTVLEEKLTAFKEIINSKAAFRSESDLGKKVNRNCDLIILALQDLVSGEIKDADKKVQCLIENYIKNEFAVSELDKSYAFRGLAPYEDLHVTCGEKNSYKKMLEEKLSFFRARVVDKGQKVCDVGDIISLPFSKRNLSKDLRFSVENEICLYLGVTSYVCSLECGYEIEKNTEKDIYLSAFKFNSRGKKLKILNLVVSEPLINGIYQKNIDGSVKRNLQNTLIELFPLVVATSFTVEDKFEKRKKYEYLLSQSIIRVIKKLDMDGVAYLSRRGKNDFQYPHGVNLAIPMKDIGESKEYSDLYQYLSCTKPFLVSPISGKSFQCNGLEKSYINECYLKYISNGSIENPMAKVDYNGKSIFYGETPYSKIDDYLLNQKFENLNGLNGKE